MKTLILILISTAAQAAPNMECSDELNPAEMVKRFCLDEIKDRFDDLNYELVRKHSMGYKIEPADRKWMNASDENAQRVVGTAAHLATIHKEKCNPKASYSSPEKDACRVLKHIKKTVKQMVAAEKEAIAMKDPAHQERAYAGKVCVSWNEYEHLKAKIAEEKEKGKVSGFVHAGRLKSWGDRAYNEKKAADRAIASYKSKYSKDFDVSRCK